MASDVWCAVSVMTIIFVDPSFVSKHQLKAWNS